MTETGKGFTVVQKIQMSHITEVIIPPIQCVNSSILQSDAKHSTKYYWLTRMADTAVQKLWKAESLWRCHLGMSDRSSRDFPIFPDAEENCASFCNCKAVSLVERTTFAYRTIDSFYEYNWLKCHDDDVRPSLNCSRLSTTQTANCCCIYRYKSETNYE